MRAFPFAVRDGARVVEVGTVHAEDERAALRQLAGAGTPLNFRPQPTRWYQIRVGALTMSARGDEMAETAAQAGAKADDVQGRAQRAAQVKRQALRALGEDALRAREREYRADRKIPLYDGDPPMDGLDVDHVYFPGIPGSGYHPTFGDCPATDDGRHIFQAEIVIGRPVTTWRCACGMGAPPDGKIDVQLRRPAPCAHRTLAAEWGPDGSLVGQHCVDCRAQLPLRAGVHGSDQDRVARYLRALHDRHEVRIDGVGRERGWIRGEYHLRGEVPRSRFVRLDPLSAA